MRSSLHLAHWRLRLSSASSSALTALDVAAAAGDAAHASLPPSAVVLSEDGRPSLWLQNVPGQGQSLDFARLDATLEAR